jgi:hypothetical protein
MTLGPDDVEGMLDILRDSSERLTAMARGMDVPWDPEISDARRLHNMYARNLVTVYVCKVSELSSAILHSVSADQFLTYALCGRSMIETVATLRYYVVHEYKPLFDVGDVDELAMRKLIEIDDKHLRGGRFDWKSFLLREYDAMRSATRAQLIGKRKNKGHSGAAASGSLPRQVNAQTCIEKWADQEPFVLTTYELFCDLVHPNIGSNFMVASESDGKIHFSKFKGAPVGRQVFDQSFPILMSVAAKSFPEFLGTLMATIWIDAEL